MGKYQPSKPRRPRTLEDLLSHAEQDHLLDCPNADFKVRAAAKVFDLILLWIVYSGIGQVTKVASLIGSQWGMLSADQLFPLDSFLKTTLRILVGYFYLIAIVSLWGGTPGKLLLGLRLIDATTGAHLSILQAVTKLVIEIVLCFATLGGTYLTALFRRDRCALHDLVSMSRVKRKY